MTQETPKREELPLRIFIARPATFANDCDGCAAFEDEPGLPFPKSAEDLKDPRRIAYNHRCSGSRRVPVHGEDRCWSCSTARDGGTHGEILVEVKP